jgi:hypothetical protein
MRWNTLAFGLVLIMTAVGSHAFVSHPFAARLGLSQNANKAPRIPGALLGRLRMDGEKESNTPIPKYEENAGGKERRSPSMQTGTSWTLGTTEKSKSPVARKTAPDGPMEPLSDVTKAFNTILITVLKGVIDSVYEVLLHLFQLVAHQLAVLGHEEGSAQPASLSFFSFPSTIVIVCAHAHV